MWEEYLQQRETDRLIIRPLTMQDEPAWNEFTMDEEATKYFPTEWKLMPQSAKEWIQFQQKRYRENKYGLQALVDKWTGKLIGQCGLLAQHVDGVDELEIGYHLMREYWGHGFAIEAASAWKSWAFEAGLADSIVSIIEITNTPSQRVAERNGMSREKQTVYYEQDVFIYRVSRKEHIMSVLGS